MPIKDDHIQIANHNKEFSQYLISENRYLDWAVTGLFYAALHYIEAYLATLKTHSRDHRVRDTSVARDSNLRRIYRQYSDLKNDSIQCRYQGHIFPIGEINSRIKPALEMVQRHIENLIP